MSVFDTDTKPFYQFWNPKSGWFGGFLMGAAVMGAVIGVSLLLIAL